MDLAERLKAAYPKALATLIRLLGDFDAAEDALQDAAERALEVWPRTAVPDEPAAWLVTTARRRHIDVIRHRRLQERYADSERHLAAELEMVEPDLRPFDDDMTRLVFTCCHPAFGRDAQTALTLRSVAGLTVEEIARAFVVPPSTIEQRITRAKRKIREARIPYEVPEKADLDARRSIVLDVVYLIFNEGYLSTAGPDLVRSDLCHEGIRLGRALCRMFPSAPDVMGLLALMLLQDARRPARVDASGAFVSLADQDRALWNAAMIAEGCALVDKAALHGAADAFQIQAAIAAVHATARDAQSTDWRKIVALYDALAELQPTAVVRLNRAAAVSKADGAAAGLVLLDELGTSPAMERYPYYHALRGALLAEVGCVDEARSAYRAALRRTSNPVEQADLEKRLAGLE